MADDLAPSGSLEALKRLKATETDAETKVQALLTEGAERLKRTREQAEEAVRMAKTEADKSAEDAIAKARAGLAGDLAAVVKVGEADAAKVGTRTKASLAALEPKIVDAVLGEFRSE
jgi:vacuolar-type H+-ATPase subunit H